MGPIEQRPTRPETIEPGKTTKQPLKMPSHPWKRKKAA